jgi:hypothetical protein
MIDESEAQSLKHSEGSKVTRDGIVKEVRDLQPSKQLAPI